jgi:hypothetical protein
MSIYCSHLLPYNKQALQRLEHLIVFTTNEDLFKGFIKITTLAFPIIKTKVGLKANFVVIDSITIIRDIIASNSN